jgi:hypothetical protein
VVLVEQSKVRENAELCEGDTAEKPKLTKLNKFRAWYPSKNFIHLQL